MMRLAMILSTILLAAAATPAAASLNCNLSMQNASGALTTYEPFASSDTVIDIALRVTNEGGSKCNARIYIDAVDGNRTLRGGGATLTYRFNGPPSGTGTGPYTVQLDGGESDIVKVQMVLPRQQVVARASYVAELVARVDAAGKGAVAFAGEGFSVSVQVPGRVEMSISGVPSTTLSSVRMAPASIDLGTMSEGQVGRAYVNIWSNGSVNVSLSSKNRGELVLDGHPSAPTVSYSATFDGVPVTFPTSVSRTPPASIVGGAYPLAVKVGSLKGRYAGRYTDVITVDVRQN